jgi:hypothetical protein
MYVVAASSYSFLKPPTSCSSLWCNKASDPLQDLSSAPCLSPNRSKSSSSLRDSWFDVEWRPPPGLEGLGPSTRLPDSSPAVPSGSNSSGTVAATSTGSTSLQGIRSPLHFRQPEFPVNSQSRMIKTPPPPSRAAMAAAKRFFLNRHSKDCVYGAHEHADMTSVSLYFSDSFSRWRRHTLLNALQRRQSQVI